jgi:hypothetical protein
MIIVNKKFWEELTAYFPWCNTGRIENNESNNRFSVSCVFIAAVTFLTSRCLAKDREISAEPLPSNDGFSHTDTDGEGFMKYAV